MKVGDKVWYKSWQNRGTLQEGVIEKIGNKYITAFNGSQFDKVTMRLKTQYTGGMLYLNIGDYENEVLHLRLSDELRRHVGQWGASNIPLNKLKQIIDIINS